jgi:hypothetical protein
MRSFWNIEVICRFGVPKYVLINNILEWAIELDQLCKIMVICINTLHFNGLDAMVWWKDW